MSFLNRPGDVRRKVLRVRTRVVLSVLIAALVLPAVALQPSPAAAYDVCDDDGSCVHEYISQQAAALFPTNPEILAYLPDIVAGTEDDDLKDHVYSFHWIGGALVTITHFWDADAGENDPVENVFGSFPNAWQKVKSLWSMALGHYAKGEKSQAYHYLGHVAHLFEDMSLPTHVHDDMHFPDDDAFEDWISLSSHQNRDLSQAEKNAITAAGPIQIPGSQPDKLLYLMHTTNQIADFFASDDYNGDAVDPLGWAQPELDAMNATITSPRTKDQLYDNDVVVLAPAVDNDNNADGDLGRIRQHSYLRSPRVIAALYNLFIETVATPIANVVIDSVDELEDHDFVCAPVCVETSNADFWSRVQINGRTAQNRGNAVTGENIDPGWTFGRDVGLTGSIPIRIEIWDEDGEWIQVATFSGPDDQSDITPGPGRSLDLTVDLAKCLSGADGAISGQASGKCGVPITIQGNTDNDEVSKLTFTIRLTKPTPTITTQASPGNLLGAPVRDTATLTGGANPTGNVTFRLFSDATCATEVFNSTNALTAQVATSGWFTPAAVGTYYWTANYNGDASNNPSASGCNAPNESVVITPFEPPPFTRTISGDLYGPVTVNTGESVLIKNARVYGPVTVNPGGALTVVNSKISKAIVANAPRFFSLCGSQVSASPPFPVGQALAVSNALVPIRVGDPANACAGNRFAGIVRLNANLATTFGANIVSHNIGVNNNGPGNTVIKANTTHQTLACAGNSPPPANASQPNAGTKTGQCAAL